MVFDAQLWCDRIRGIAVASLTLLVMLAPVVATGASVPKAVCGPSDRVETLQGSTSRAERESGLSELGFNCNLELVGQYQGQGSQYMMDWFEDCAYYGTAPNPQQTRLGTVVIDASDPRNPEPTAYLDTPGMRYAWESLKVHKGRRLIAATERLADGFDVYDLSGDCRQPVLRSTIRIPEAIGHAGNFTPDGMTYYASQDHRGLHAMMPIIDVSDPSQPKHLLNWEFGTQQGRPHDPYFSADGTRMYAGQPGQFGNVGSSIGPNGLVILDISDIQFRRPNPEIRVISTHFWEDGGQAQQALPITIRGRPYILFTDESGAGGVGGRQGACNRGMPPSGFARLIDISDEKNPKTVSKLMLEANDPANCPIVLTDPPANNYSSHYCNVDDERNAKMAACTWRDAGLRVFDIRDPLHPKEIAYYKPPARRTQFLPGSQLWSPTADRTVDHTPTQVRWRRHNGETHLWFASQDNGFQIVRFTNGVGRAFCDIDESGQIDRNDINQIFASRGTVASSSSDPRDADGDGVISVADARSCTLSCTKPQCAR